MLENRKRNWDSFLETSGILAHIFSPKKEMGTPYVATHEVSLVGKESIKKPMMKERIEDNNKCNKMQFSHGEEKVTHKPKTKSVEKKIIEEPTPNKPYEEEEVTHKRRTEYETKKIIEEPTPKKTIEP